MNTCAICGGQLTLGQRRVHRSCEHGLRCTCRSAEAGSPDQYRLWLAANVEPIIGPVAAALPCEIHGDKEVA